MLLSIKTSKHRVVKQTARLTMETTTVIVMSRLAFWVFCNLFGAW